MFFKPRKQQQTESPIDRHHALKCVPLKNPQAVEHDRDEGILLIYPVTVKPFFRRLAKLVTRSENQSITRKIQLDSMGSTVWKLIDGQRNVAEISEIFRETNKLDRREAEISVGTFFRELGRRGLVVLRGTDSAQKVSARK